MPSTRIHEVIAKKINKEIRMDELLLRIGTVAPDSWRNALPKSSNKDKYLSHFLDSSIKLGDDSNYIKYYKKYNNQLNNPFYFGYLIHLIVDQYWKAYIDPRYERIIDDQHFVKLKDGTLKKNENWFSYFEGIKMQKQIAKIFDLGIFPINVKDIPNLEYNIDELNFDGIFGKSGTLSYINKETTPSENDEESEVYDNDSIIKAINETSEFVIKELHRLDQLLNNR